MVCFGCLLFVISSPRAEEESWDPLCPSEGFLYLVSMQYSVWWCSRSVHATAKDTSVAPLSTPFHHHRLHHHLHRCLTQKAKDGLGPIWDAGHYGFVPLLMQVRGELTSVSCNLYWIISTNDVDPASTCIGLEPRKDWSKMQFSSLRLYEHLLQCLAISRGAIFCRVSMEFTNNRY